MLMFNLLILFDVYWRFCKINIDFYNYFGKQKLFEQENNYYDNTNYFAGGCGFSVWGVGWGWGIIFPGEYRLTIVNDNLKAALHIKSSSNIFKNT